MKTQRKRTVISRAVGAGLVIGGPALSVVACSPGHRLSTKPTTHTWKIGFGSTQTVSTPLANLCQHDFLATTAGYTVSGNTAGNTVSGNTAGNTVVWQHGR